MNWLLRLFKCQHNNTTTPRKIKGGKIVGNYVVCLDCGKELAYTKVDLTPTHRYQSV